MSETVHLKSGEDMRSLSLLPNPQSEIDARILRDVCGRYNIEHLEGVVVNLEDWEDINGTLFENQFQSQLPAEDPGNTVETGDPIESKPLLIYPDLSPLMGYSYGDEDDSILLLTLDNGDFVIPRDMDLLGILQQLADANEQGKRRLRKQLLNPILEERETIQNILEFQVQQGADIALAPGIPITSMQDFPDRVDLIQNVCRTSSAIVEGGLLSEDVDLMHVFSINPTVLRRPEDGVSTREDQLVAMMSDFNPDMFGIHLQDLNHEHQDRVQALLDVIERISQDLNVPTFLLNVDEFGLAAFDYGVDYISGPIASTPYTRFSNGDSTVTRGKYYHYENLFGYTRERLMDMTRPEYLLPCYCEICEHFERIPAVDEEYWNVFRRIHYLLVKDIEVKRLRETDKVLREALRDLFANSERTDLASYL